MPTNSASDGLRRTLLAMFCTLSCWCLTSLGRYASYFAECAPSFVFETSMFIQCSFFIVEVQWRYICFSDLMQIGVFDLFQLLWLPTNDCEVLHTNLFCGRL